MILGRRALLAHVADGRLVALRDPTVQAQPCGIDLSVERIERFKGPGRIDFCNARRSLPDTELLPWVEHEDGPRLWLPAGCYKAVFAEAFDIPNDLMTMPLPRSSLLRMGVCIHGAVGDPGYRGKMVALLVVYNPSGVIVEKDARLLQVVCLRLDEAQEGYRGVYQNTL